MRKLVTFFSFRGLVLLLVCQALLSNCYFVDYFQPTQASKSEESQILAPDAVLGQFLGRKASEVNEAALEAVYAISTSIPPANIRPDPDLYARRLLLQYRPEGTTVARLIGSIEAYRPLLGGASADFSKQPQDEFDATSLLATFSVSQVVCEGLVSPNSWMHGDWQSILPADPNDWNTNIRFLIQRLTARPEAKITDEMVFELKTIMDNERAASDRITNQYDYSNYVPVCSVLTIDPQAQHL